MNAHGSILARVFTSNAMLPVIGAAVAFVRRRSDGTTELLAYRTTNYDGMTVPIDVDTPELDGTTLASSGKRVVLVDCDMRKSAVSRYLRIPRSRTGLTNVITSHEENALSSALIRMKDTGITVLPVGTIPPNPAELLASSATEKIFKALQNAFDYVIVDTPPVSVVTDAAVLCRVADGVLLVVRPGVTTIQGAQLSKKNLEAVHAHILGVIMNGYNAKKTGRRDGYSYAYSYGYYDSKQETDE